jgi:hypothetical protein
VANLATPNAIRFLVESGAGVQQSAMNLNTLSSFIILPVVYFTRGIDFSETTAQGDTARRFLVVADL